MPKQKNIIEIIERIQLIEDENIFFEDINDWDKFIDELDNMEE